MIQVVWGSREFKLPFDVSVIPIIVEELRDLGFMCQPKSNAVVCYRKPDVVTIIPT